MNIAFRFFSSNLHWVFANGKCATFIPLLVVSYWFSECVIHVFGCSAIVESKWIKLPEFGSQLSAVAGLNKLK